MKDTIGYYVHHHGSGHRHRALALRAALRDLAGVEVTLLSSAEPPAAYDGEWVLLPRDDRATHVEDPDAHGHLHWAPRHDVGLRDRMAALSAWIGRARPRLLVSDVSQEVTLLARLHGVPVVSVVLPGQRTDAAHLLGLGVSDAVVGFWPAEAEEICPGLPADIRARLRRVGALSRFPPVEPGPDRPGNHRVTVLAGTGGDGFDAATLSGAAQQTPGWAWTVLGPGSWVSDPWAAIREADVVVSRAGQNSVAEIAAARVPAVLVPGARPHDEQVTTARVLAAGPWPVLVEADLPRSGWAQRLDAAAGLDGAGWSSWCDGSAAERFAGIILDLLEPAVAA